MTITERERVGKDKGIRGSSVSSRATCCLLDVHCRCPQPVHTPYLLKYSYQLTQPTSGSQCSINLALH